MMGLPFWVSAAIAAIGSIVGFAAGEKSNWHAKRTRDLHESMGLLDTYMEDLEKFCADEAAPVELKRFLLGFCDLLSNEEFVDAMSVILLRNEKRLERRSASRVIKRLDDLALYRGDLASLFYAIFKTSLLAAFLRWPDTAKVSKKLAIRLALDLPKSDLSAALHTKAVFSPNYAAVPDQLEFA
jgi:hypothetical protein